MTVLHGSPAPTSPATGLGALPAPRSSGATSVNGGPAFAQARLLWTRVEEARVALADLRCSKPNTLHDARARAECLEALQAYADCLVAQNRPVPYALRDELRLMRLTCGTTSGW